MGRCGFGTLTRDVDNDFGAPRRPYNGDIKAKVTRSVE